MKKKLLAILAIVIAAIAIPSAIFAWGPIRETFTIEVPATYVTFNSITNNPNIGDERNFVGIRETGTSNLWSDEITAERDKTYTVRMYVHNNAADNYNLVAENVTARFNLPTATSKSLRVDGFLSSTNAKPTEVYDHATFVASEDFNLNYVEGSLKYENNHFGANGVALPESIFTTAGTKLGYTALDGKIPGCFQYAGYVTFKVTPQFADKPDFTVVKQVRKTGATGANSWVETQSVNPGDSVDFLITYTNTGDTTQTDVIVKDVLPKGLTYVAGSTYVANATNPNGIKVSDNITKTGINIGNYASTAVARIRFSATVASNADLVNCGLNTLINNATVDTKDGSKSDTATVTVNKTCDKPKVVYTCNKIKSIKTGEKSYDFTTDYTLTNATLSSITYVVKNSKGEVVATQSNNQKFSYTFGDDTKYTIQATINAVADGKAVTATSEGCSTTIVIDVPKVVYTCNKLSASKIGDKAYKFTTSYTLENATLSNITYVVKNSKGEVIKTEVGSDTFSYTIGDDTKYSIQATVNAVAGGKAVTATSEGCVATIATELPHTGVGEVAFTLFGLGSIVTSAGYYIASRRALLGR